MEENNLKKKVGRPIKYNTNEERKQAIRESKRNYMRKIRAMINAVYAKPSNKSVVIDSSAP